MRNKVSPKAKMQISSLEESFQPILWFDRIMGTTVFEMPIGQYWPKLSIVYSFSKFAAYATILWYALTHIPKKKPVFPILTEVSKIILAVNILILLVATISGLQNYKNVKGFLKRVTLADETLEVFGVDPEYTLAYKENVRLVIAWVCIGSLTFCIDIAGTIYAYGNDYNALIRVSVLEFPLLLNAMIELNFAVKISTIGKRFQRLNALIQSVTTSPLQSVPKCENVIKSNQNQITVKSIYQSKNKNNIEHLLKATRQLHLDLCTTSREVNDGTSKLISMQMGATFLLLTGFSYCFYLVYNEPSTPFIRKSQHYSTLLIWIVLSICRMIYIVRTSVNVATEAQKTSQIAHEIQVSRSNNKLIDEIHQLSLQIMQHPLYFTASGLIVLDFGYVRGFVGSVTTYLMILIQNQPDMIPPTNIIAESSSANNTNETSVSSFQ